MICTYCGENEATTTIPNPNVFGEVCKENCWDVCEGCKEAIDKAIKEDIKMLFERSMKDANCTKDEVKG